MACLCMGFVSMCAEFSFDFWQESFEMRACARFKIKGAFDPFQFTEKTDVIYFDFVFPCI